jgi:hypothetical protein
LSASAQLIRLKKVYNKVCSKKYHLIKQGLCKLKADKKKKSKIEMAYIVEVGSINTPNPYLLPLFGFFNFDLSFLILPNIISDNMPVPFL